MSGEEAHIRRPNIRELSPAMRVRVEGAFVSSTQWCLTTS
jgi:hypothetical protein